VFGVGEDGKPTAMGAKQHSIAIEQPNLTLEEVILGMVQNEDCQNVPAIRRRYAEKVFAVLRVVAKALRHLHGVGLVHGGLSTKSCGKYGNQWKVSDVLGIRRSGDSFGIERTSMSPPPESLEVDKGRRGWAQQAFMKESLEARPSIDAWAFGTLAFEVLVGAPLFPALDIYNVEDEECREAMNHIYLWNDHNLQEVRERLALCFVSEAGINLILECLSPQPEMRPTMSEILSRPFWNEIRRNGSREV